MCTMEPISFPDQLRKLADHIEKNPDTLNRMRKIGLFGDHDLAVRIIDNNWLFSLYSQMRCKRARLPEVLELLKHGDGKEVAIHFANLDIYGVFEVADYCGLAAMQMSIHCKKHRKLHPTAAPLTAELYQIVLAESKQKLIFRCDVNAVESIRGHIRDYLRSTITVAGDGETKEISVNGILVENWNESRDMFDKLYSYIRGQDSAVAGKIQSIHPWDDEKFKYITPNVSTMINIEERAEICIVLKTTRTPVRCDSDDEYYLDEPIDWKSLCIVNREDNSKLRPAALIQKKKMNGSACKKESCLDDSNSGTVGYVYFIAEEPFMNRIKIGMSGDPYARVKQLQTGNANKLVVKHVVATEKYKQMEKLLHVLCKEEHLRGEWFSINESQFMRLISGAK